MTTRTAGTSKTKKQAKMEERDRQNERINTALGFTSREERLQHDRYSAGTNGYKQRPRYREGVVDGFRPMAREAERVFVQLIEAINPEAGREGAYPHDVAQTCRYAVGQELTIHLIGQDWSVRVVHVAAMFDRWRVKVEFLTTDASFTVTAAQLAHIEVAPVVIRDHQSLMKKYGLDVQREAVTPVTPVTLAPTHLLPPPTTIRFHYRDLVLEGAAAVRVQERIARHWQRQIGKLVAPGGVELPRVLYA